MFIVLLLCIKTPRCHMCWSYGIMHHFIASLAILFFKTYSAHGLVTFWKILVRARRYSTMSSSRVKCTTLRTGSQSDVALLTMTLCFLSVSQHFIHLDIFPPIPFAAIFSINLRCGTLSKVLAKSMYSVSTGTPLSISDAEYLIPDVWKWHL